MTSLGAKNKKTLRKFFGIGKMRPADVYGVDSDEKAYEMMRLEYNTIISDLRRQDEELRREKRKKSLRKRLDERENDAANENGFRERKREEKINLRRNKTRSGEVNSENIASVLDATCDPKSKNCVGLETTDHPSDSFVENIQVLIENEVSVNSSGEDNNFFRGAQATFFLEGDCSQVENVEKLTDDVYYRASKNFVSEDDYMMSQNIEIIAEAEMIEEDCSDEKIEILIEERVHFDEFIEESCMETKHCEEERNVFLGGSGQRQTDDSSANYEITFDIVMYHRLDNSKYSTRNTTEVILFDGVSYTKEAYGNTSDLTKFQGRVYKAFSNSDCQFSGHAKYRRDVEAFGGFILSASPASENLFNLLKALNYPEYLYFIDKMHQIQVSNHVDLFEIVDLDVRAVNNGETNFGQDPACDDSRAACLSFKYINHRITSDFSDLAEHLYKSKYVRENFVKQSCWLSIVLDIYREQILKIKNIVMTYESLFYKIFPKDRLLKKSFNSEGPNPCSFNDIVRGFFMDNHIAVYVFDVNCKIVDKFEPKQANGYCRAKNLHPCCLYVLHHDNHIYCLDQQKSLEQVIKRMVEESNSVVECPGNKYKLCTKDNIQYKRITCKEDIVKLATEVVQQPAKKTNEKSSKQPEIHAIYEEGCILNLWHKLYRDKRVKFECSLRMKDRNIIGFDILNINGRNIFVRGTQEVGVIEDIYFGDEKKYNSYRNLRQEMFSKFLCSTYKSNYSEQVRKMLHSHIKGGIIGSFISYPTAEELQCHEIDHIKFYTSIFAEMEFLPVVNSFDNFVDFSEGMSIENYTLYFVEKLDDSLEYPLNRFELCFGLNIKDILKKVRIISFLRPSKLFPNSAKEAIQKLFQNQSIDIAMKKAIMNSLIGMTDKRYNKSDYCSVFKNEEECNFTLKYRLIGGKKIIKILPDKSKIFIAYLQEKTELIDGFKLISYFIKDTANKKLFELKRKLENCKLQVVGVNTDSCYVIKNEALLNQFKSSYPELFTESSDEFARIGKVKITEKPYDWKKCVQVKCNDFVYSAIEKTKINHIDISDEWNKDIISEVYASNNRVICKAECAGAGKTSSFKHFVHGKKALFVCPYNNLCFEIIRETFEAITLHRLLGIKLDDDKNEASSYDFKISEYDIVIFDEIFLCTIDNLERMRQLMEKYQDKQFYATGDEYQLPPIENHLNVPNKKEYYKAAVATLFPNQITLKENKRCKSLDDRRRIKEISDKIRNAKSKTEALSIIYKHFKTVSRLEDVVSENNVVFTNRCGDYINNFIHSKKSPDRMYFEGLKLIGSHTGETEEGHKIYANYTYLIVRIADDVAHIDNLEEVFPVKLSELDMYFELPYARTCHSMQGLSVEGEITIFEIDHPYASIEWLYTAITRTTDLSKVSIFRGTLPKMPPVDTRAIRKRISQHQQADRKAGRTFDGASYITVKWITDTLERTHYCPCGRSLGVNNYSVDRINNALPHTLINCRIICKPCNVANK